MSLRAKVATAALTVAVATVVVTATAPAAPALAQSEPGSASAGGGTGAGAGAGDEAGSTTSPSPSPLTSASPVPEAANSVAAAPRYVTDDYRLPSGRFYFLRTVVGPGPRRPLVVLLHGLGQDPATAEQMSAASQFADDHGFALAYGDGIDSAWNAGRCCTPFAAPAPTAVDDVAYLRELVEHASATTAVDRRRVYVWGFSNGGMMAWRAVCEAGDVFAAAGVVGGQLMVECGQSTVAVVHVHGLADTTVPWRGGWSEFLGVDLSDGVLEGSLVGPGSTVEHLTWDGGHTWPEWAVDALWEFSSAQALPPPNRIR